MNPYEVLGVKKNATEKEIRGRYRGLSSMYHPDKEGGDRSKFEEVKEAHDILTDPHRRKDGTSDDPVWENIRDKLLMSILASRAPLKNERFKLQRKLERCQRMIERFKATTDYDPVGIALRGERKRLEAELLVNQDAMELSIEAERVFRLYSYDVGPGSEGQINPGPTGHRLLGGSRLLR
jgi:hypothetical protein